MLSYLGFAVAYRRIGIVVLKEGELRHWQIAKAAYATPDKLTTLVHALIDAHDPTVVVIERTGEGCRKGAGTQQRIAVIADVARERGKLIVAAPRTHDFVNKYEEAEALVQRYPDLCPWAPERAPCWENEPRQTILFEALALTDAVMRGPTTDLAAAMG